jgi:Prokaryotic N-terminal methylation motif
MIQRNCIAPRTSRHAPRTKAGFTLIETALATVIIGVGVLALIETNQSLLSANSWSTHTSTGTLLSNEIREITRNYPRHDSFAGGIYFQDPQTHSGFTGWGPESDETDPSLFDDVDDFDGVVFGDAADADLPGPVATFNGQPLRFPGPINAMTRVIPQTLWSGQSQVDETGGVVALAGWSQYVQVEKVDPLDFNVVLDDDYYEPATISVPERRVERFPLRVTVTTLYQGPYETSARVIAQHTWIVPD